MALLAPMGPHLRKLHLRWPVPAHDLALLAGSLTALTELRLDE